MGNPWLIAGAIVCTLMMNVAASGQSMLETAESRMSADLDKAIGSIAGIVFVCFKDQSLLGKIERFMKTVPPMYRAREEINFKAGIDLGAGQLVYDLTTRNATRWECSDTRIQIFKRFIDEEMAKRGIE